MLPEVGSTIVPPWVPHREENPGSEPAVVVLARSTQAGVVVNLPSLWAEVEVEAAVEGRFPSQSGS